MRMGKHNIVFWFVEEVSENGREEEIEKTQYLSMLHKNVGTMSLWSLDINVKLAGYDLNE